MFAEMCSCLETVLGGLSPSHIKSDQVRGILNCMAPWLRNIKLEFRLSEEVGNPLEQPKSLSDVILNNLFYISTRLSDEYVNELENVWVSLVDMDSLRGGDDANRIPNAKRNVDSIVDYLIYVGIHLRNPGFIPVSKKIAVFLGRTAACKFAIDALMKRITPRSLIPPGPNVVDKRLEGDESAPDIPNRGGASAGHNIEIGGYRLHMLNVESVLLEMPKRPMFTRGQLALIMMVDLIVEVGVGSIRSHLPLLLHVIIVHMDHFMTVICDQSRLVLQNILTAISGEVDDDDRLRGLLASVVEKEGKRMWAYEDISSSQRSTESFDQMASLIDDVIELLLTLDSEIDQKWGTVALTWGTSCPVRHIACRSLQIFRILTPVFDQKMLGELLHRLSNTIADSTEDIQGFALEILQTLEVMLDNLDRQKAILFPQFFWAFIAVLESPYEWEFFESVKLLDKYFSKLNLEDSATEEALLAQIPPKWRTSFVGVQPMLLKGIKTTTSQTDTLKLLQRLLSINDDFIVDSTPNRALRSSLAFVTKLCFALESAPNSALRQDSIAIAASLASLCEKRTLPKLSRFFVAYSKGRIQSRDEFLKQFVNILPQEFFPSQKLPTVQCLIELLTGSDPYQRELILAILKAILPALESSDFRLLQEENLSPLVSILRIKGTGVALEVADELMKVSTDVQETSLKVVFGGKTIYRMTKELASEEEFSSTHDSLSGWNVANFNEVSSLTRQNLDSAASACRSSIESGANKKKMFMTGSVFTGRKVSSSKQLVSHSKGGSFNATGMGLHVTDRKFSKPSSNLIKPTARLLEGALENFGEVFNAVEELDLFFKEPLIMPNPATMPTAQNLGPATDNTLIRESPSLIHQPLPSLSRFLEGPFDQRSVSSRKASTSTTATSDFVYGSDDDLYDAYLTVDARPPSLRLPIKDGIPSRLVQETNTLVLVALIVSKPYEEFKEDAGFQDLLLRDIALAVNSPFECLGLPGSTSFDDSRSLLVVSFRPYQDQNQMDKAQILCDALKDGNPDCLAKLQRGIFSKFVQEGSAWLYLGALRFF